MIVNTVAYTDKSMIERGVRNSVNVTPGRLLPLDDMLDSTLRSLTRSLVFTRRFRCSSHTTLSLSHPHSLRK